MVLRDGKRIGHNTDWWGFAENFRRNMADAPRRRVVQFGAGGAGSAVAYALMTSGVENLIVVDVNRSRAEQVAASLCARFGANRVKAGTEDAVATADGVVNTTPLVTANSSMARSTVCSPHFDVTALIANPGWSRRNLATTGRTRSPS